MMAPHRFSASRVLTGGFALAVLAAPVVAAFVAVDPPAQAVAACPAGESMDVYTTVCVPDLVPNSPAPFSTNPGNPDVPTIGGIPCIGRSAASCVGLAEEQEAQGPQPVPRSTVSSSP
jgi:hypothetical protein